jgi:predicted MFS family arabinose efflux permease
MSTLQSGTGAKATPVRSYQLYVLAILLVVYTFNFIDRIVLGILVTPIKLELHLTDTELGFLGGTAFALFYTALGVPIGWLADRVNRVWIMAGALACWSAFTAGSGLAHSFLQLFVARLGVGVGEAGGVAPAYSLISDYFQPNQRARALGFYSLGIPVGSALGLLFGGYLAVAVSWRAAFIVLGIAGILLAPLLIVTLREPKRGQLDAGPRIAAASLPELARTLASKPSFWLLSGAAACSSIMGYGLLFWLPSFFMRSYGLSISQVSHFYAGLLLIGGVAGIGIGSILADRLGKRSRSAYALIPAVAFFLILPCYAYGVFRPPGAFAFVFFLIPTALQLAWLGPVISAIQHLVPPNMRTVASATFLFINNLLGLGLGSLLIGFASDELKARFGSESLRYAILGGTGFYVLAGVLFLLAARYIKRDWIEQAS